MRRVIAADAILYPVDQANVTTKISAPVSRFLVKRGDRVRKGQLLAVIVPDELRADRAFYSHSADAATGQLESSQAALRLQMKSDLVQAGLPHQTVKR